MSTDEANGSPPLPRQPPPPPPKPKLSDRLLAGIVEEKPFALPIIPPTNTMKTAMTSNAALLDNNNQQQQQQQHNNDVNNIEMVEEVPIDVGMLENGNGGISDNTTGSSPPPPPATTMNIETCVDGDECNGQGEEERNEGHQSNNNNLAKQQPPRYSDRNYTDGPIDDTYYNKLPHWSQHIAFIENVSISE